MIDHPDIEGQDPVGGPLEGPQEKLILPAIPDAKSSPYSGPLESNAYSGPVQTVGPGQLLRPKVEQAPKDPIAKLGYYWRKDPAYKVLILATVMVVLAGIVFMSLASATILQIPNLLSQNNIAPQNGPSSTSGPVNLHPTFPTPGGGSGGTASSQPPSSSGTPVLQVTPTVSILPTTPPNPTPTAQSGGALTVQIVSIPSQVANNSTVWVAVTTNEPGVTVRLQISYSAPPFVGSSASRKTDDNGNAVLPWYVRVYRFGGNVTATVVAVAVDQNGQQAESAPVEVEVISSRGLP